MSRFHTSTRFDDHTCYECVGYNLRERKCMERRSIYHGTLVEPDMMACKDIQYHTLHAVSIKRKRKKIESIYDYE